MRRFETNPPFATTSCPWAGASAWEREAARRSGKIAAGEVAGEAAAGAAEKTGFAGPESL